PRIVEAVFEPRNRTGPFVRLPVFQCSGERFDQLPESRPASVAIPGNLRPQRNTPRAAQRFVHWQLRKHPKRARVPGDVNSLSSDLIFKCGRKAASFPLGNAIRKETPEFERRIRLLRAIEDGLLNTHVFRGAVGELPAGAWNIV